MRSTEGLRSSWWLAVTREKTQMPTPVGISARSCCWVRGGPARVRWAQSGSRSSRAALDVIGLCRLRQRECLATKALPERDRHNPMVGIIGVDPEQREGHDLRDLLQRCDHPLAGLVAHRPVLGPPGGDVGDGERVAVLTDRVAAFVADQVDLDEPGHRVVPLCPGPDRDRVLAVSYTHLRAHE